jgi:hypothetical protein
MKVLFLSHDRPDYLETMIYHGFYSTKNTKVYSNSDFWYLFKTAEFDDLHNLYGRGFGYSGILCGHQNKLINHQIIKLLQERYFDLIVYGQANKSLRYLGLVKRVYPINKVIYLDGEDDNYDSISAKEFFKLVSSSLYHLNIHPKIKMLFNINIRFRNLGKFYFKREINNNPYNFSPISFSMPPENIIDEVPKLKKKTISSLIPGIRETYRYSDQFSYFEEYQKSRYAITYKKGGWDCFRHYEILANGCIPIFPDLVTCPELTMFSFPKELILEVNSKLLMSDLNEEEYNHYSKKLLEYTKENLTTLKMVNYILETIGYHND